MENPSKETLDKWHKDPNNWKLGLIYYNKEDKRTFPPRKYGWTGWTVNFANPTSIIVTVFVIILIFLIMFNIN